MFAKSIVAVALLAGSAAAQTTANSTIVPTSVSATIRAQWCAGQQNTCPVLCGGQAKTKSNDCDVNTLDIDCTCRNGSAPGLMYYTSTMPTFICQQIFDECIQAGQNNAQAQKLCTDARTANCGTLDPSKYVEPASTSSAAPSATAPPPAATPAVASSSSAAAAAPTAISARDLASGFLAAGVAALGLL
ncbi:hypothetical protein HYALB_00010644 [Hymenoscyphus albidus]|uniref:DUF7707 domain-containing protein n=1 Tax=Hymenoscyphus albidus TaxID=595503 RepID=A0A9N9LI14_9HELO|nr:hypothetical protein HYALB_00010644 [Hymenoscyphus albidus]